MYLKTFKKTCFEMFELDLGSFLTAPGLVWKADLSLSDTSFIGASKTREGGELFDQLILLFVIEQQ